MEKEDDEELNKYNSYYEFFCNYLFPQAIEYGMNTKEFWEDDPQLFVSFRISFIKKKEREIQEEDYKSWLTGVYVHHGNSIILAKLQQFIVNIFSKNRKNTKIESYPLYPYSQMKEKEKEQEKEEKQRYKDFVKEYTYVGTLKQQFLDKMSKKEKESR